MRQLTQAELLLITGGRAIKPMSGGDGDDPVYDDGSGGGGVFWGYSGTSESDIYGGEYNPNASFSDYTSQDIADRFNPDPNQYYFSGTTSEGNLMYNAFDTFQTPDGATQVDEVEVMANPTDRDLGVFFIGVDGSVAAGLGFTGGFGAYLDMRDHGVTIGLYDSEGIAVGEGASVGVMGGGYSSVQAFSGVTASVSATSGAGVTVAGGVNQDGFGVGAGGNLGVGVTATSAYTNVHPLLNLN